MPCVLVKFCPPFQVMLVIASVSLLVLQATTKLLVVTVLLVGSIWALAVEASAVRTARTARNRTEAWRTRGLILKERSRVMDDLLSRGQSRTYQFVRKCASRRFTGRGSLWNLWPWSKAIASGLCAQKMAISASAVTAAAW